MNIEQLIEALDETCVIREAKVHLIDTKGNETIIPLLVSSYEVDAYFPPPLKIEGRPEIARQPMYTIKLVGSLTDFVKRMK